MAPSTPKRSITRNRFEETFKALKTTTYSDPAARGPGHSIKSIAWNANGSFVATASADKLVRVWNPERKEVRYSTELRGHTASVERVVFNPTKEAELATCSRDGSVKFWDVRTKSCVQTINVGGDLAYLTWSKDGQDLLVGSLQDTLTPIKATPEDPEKAFTTGPSQHEKTNININECIFTNARPSKHVLMTTSTGDIRIAEYPSFHPVYTINAHTSSCLSLALAPSGRYMAIGGTDSLISLYDTKDFICHRTLTTQNAGAIKGVSFSFDGSYVVGAWEMDKDSAGAQPELAIYHVETGDNVYTIHPGNGRSGDQGVSAVAWHPLRNWLAYCAGSSTGAELKIVGAGSSV